MVRLPWMKEFDVKIPMIMLVAGAAIALAAPLANAASTKKLNTAPVHKVVKHAKTTKIAKPSGKLGTPGTSEPVTPKPPLYIFVPGYSGPALAADPADECQSSGVNCTDTQLCEFWGENCSTAIAPSTDQTGATASVDQSGDTQPAATVSTSETQSDSSELSAASSGDAQSASDMATDDASNDC